MHCIELGVHCERRAADVRPLLESGRDIVSSHVSTRAARQLHQSACLPVGRPRRPLPHPLCVPTYGACQPVHARLPALPPSCIQHLTRAESHPHTPQGLFGLGRRQCPRLDSTRLEHTGQRQRLDRRGEYPRGFLPSPAIHAHTMRGTPSALCVCSAATRTSPRLTRRARAAFPIAPVRPHATLADGAARTCSKARHWLAIQPAIHSSPHPHPRLRNAARKRLASRSLA